MKSRDPNHEWRRWFPTRFSEAPDDRWTGYHDPVTGVRLPYTRPINHEGHYHPESNGFDARCDHCQSLRNLGGRER